MSNAGNPRGRGRPDYTDEPSSSSGAKRQRDEDDNQANKRSTSDKRRSRKKEQYEIVRTRPENIEKSSHCPGLQDQFAIEANYFKLKPIRDFSIFKYHVTFEPECESRRLQSFLIGHHRNVIGGYCFDGAQLFATQSLHRSGETSVEYQTTTRDEQVYTVKLRFTRLIPLTQQEALQLLNLILRRNMKGLHMARVGRNFYDPSAMIDLREFRIQLWPGYETSVRNHQDGILLNCDVAHKTMRTDTVYDLLTQIRRSNPNDFMRVFQQKMLGETVLTMYNNKTHRIDDVSFDITPSSTFLKKDKEITILQYYAEMNPPQIIRDPRQPLLISNPRDKELRGGQRQPAWLVPELCRITGLNQEQRSNMSLKLAMKPYSQMVPSIRRQRLIDFNNRIRRSEEYESTRNEFGLELERNLVTVQAHLAKISCLHFGNATRLELVNQNRASWDRECGRSSHPLFAPEDLKRWAVIFPRNMEREMRQLVARMIEFSRNMKFVITDPKWLPIDDDRSTSFLNEISKIGAQNPRLILCGTTTNSKRNTDLYEAIKKGCFITHAIPCQVVTRHILQQRNRFDSVATKLAIQMCVKLGGAPWTCPTPPERAMTIGFDVAKDSKSKSKTYGCLVATMDIKEGPSFFSAVSTIEGGDCTQEFVMNVVKALNAYEGKHSTLPEIIFIYRGGVSDGELGYIRDVELTQLNAAIAKRYANAPPKLVYIVVSKMINTRFWQKDNCRNPEPGTVIDKTITLEERYEFFMVSQRAGQGTVSPTNYNILYDTSGIEPFGIQKRTYLHCHLYFNWCGTTRIPAVLQYANKLGYLISNYMHRPPNETLCDKLFFL